MPKGSSDPRIVSSCGNVWIYGNAPLLEQPFWDVEPIPALFAPPVQLLGEDIRVCGEV